MMNAKWKKESLTRAQILYLYTIVSVPVFSCIIYYSIELRENFFISLDSHMI